MNSSNRVGSFSLSDLMLVTTTIGLAVIVTTKAFPRHPGTTSFDSILLLALALVGWTVSFFVLYCLSARETLICLMILITSSAFMLSNWFQVSWLVLGIGGTIAVLVLKANLKRRLGWLALWLAGSLISGHLMNYYFPPSRLVRLLEARQAYPVVDLTSRLSRYGPASLGRARQFERIDTNDTLYEELQSREERNSSVYINRSNYLARLHDQKYREFIESIGFGPVRMITLWKGSVELPPIQSIPFDARSATAEQIYDDKSISQQILRSGELDDEFLGSLDSLVALLRRSYLDFFNPNTLGWSPEPKKAAGFEPHAFRFPTNEVIHDGKRYEVKKLELVGVLVSDEPRVYVLDHLPRMDEIADPKIRTRELSPFERQSLERLMAGETVVLEENQNQINMLGALRALDSCSQCHDCSRGDLMGAFSYLLLQK